MKERQGNKLRHYVSSQLMSQCLKEVRIDFAKCISDVYFGHTAITAATKGSAFKTYA